MAHFLLELGARPRLVGLAYLKRYACPLSQYMLADALGLPAVHLNRVLRELRETGLCTFQKGRVTVDNYAGLVAMCGFDRAYLDHDGPLLCWAAPARCRGGQGNHASAWVAASSSLFTSASFIAVPALTVFIFSTVVAESEAAMMFVLVMRCSGIG